MPILPGEVGFEVNIATSDPELISSFMKSTKVTLEAEQMVTKAEINWTLSSPTVSSMKDKLIRHKTRVMQRHTALMLRDVKPNVLREQHNVSNEWFSSKMDLILLVLAKLCIKQTKDP